jgi:pyruvate,water dikinase
MVAQVIGAAHAAGRKIGICGQAPSDYLEFARFLVTNGIDSLSLNPDSQLKTMVEIAELEQMPTPAVPSAATPTGTRQ